MAVNLGDYPSENGGDHLRTRATSNEFYMFSTWNGTDLAYHVPRDDKLSSIRLTIPGRNLIFRFEDGDTEAHVSFLYPHSETLRLLCENRADYSTPIVVSMLETSIVKAHMEKALDLIYTEMVSRKEIRCTDQTLYDSYDFLGMTTYTQIERWVTLQSLPDIWNSIQHANTIQNTKLRAKVIRAYAEMFDSFALQAGRSGHDIAMNIKTSRNEEEEKYVYDIIYECLYCSWMPDCIMSLLKYGRISRKGLDEVVDSYITVFFGYEEHMKTLGINAIKEAKQLILTDSPYLAYFTVKVYKLLYRVHVRGKERDLYVVRVMFSQRDKCLALDFMGKDADYVLDTYSYETMERADYEAMYASVT